MAQFNPQTLEERINEAILSAYKLDELRTLVRIDLNIDLDTIVATEKDLQTVVSNLVQWATRHGRLFDLVQTAAKRRPQRKDFAALASEVAAAEANEKAPASVPYPVTVRSGIARDLSSVVTRALLVALSVFAFATLFFQFVPPDPPRVRFSATILCVAISATTIGICELLLDRRTVRKMWNDVVTPVRASIESKTSHRALWRALLILYVVCVAPFVFLALLLLTAILCVAFFFWVFSSMSATAFGDEREAFRFTNTQVATFLAIMGGFGDLIGGCCSVVWRRIKARIRRSAD